MSSLSSEDKCACALLLNWGLLQFPKLLSELPGMMASFDSGEVINIDAISEKDYREFFQDLFRYFPVSRVRDGFAKNPQTPSASGFILGMLLDCEAVVQPTKLRDSERKASQRVVVTLLTLIEVFPELRSELPGLFESLLDGHAVQLDSIDNSDVRDGLESLFEAMGLVPNKDGAFDAESRDAQDIVKYALRIFDQERQHLKVTGQLSASSSYKATAAAPMSSSSASSVHRHDKRRNKEEASSDSQDDDGSSNDDEDGSDGACDRSDAVSPSGEVNDATASDPAKRTSIVAGPMRPNLTALRDSTERSGADVPTRVAVSAGRDDEDDADDEVGPQFQTAADISARRTAWQALPLGFIGNDSSAASALRFAGNAVGDGYTGNGDGTGAADVNAREDWILNPGESKALSALTGGGGGGPRRFQSGKQAKQLAEFMSKERERIRKEAEKDPEQPRLNQLAEQQYKEMRGPSLMEQHLASSDRKKQRLSADDMRRPFDREKDVLGHRGMGTDKVSELVKNAQELGKRFDRGMTQKFT